MHVYPHFLEEISSDPERVEFRKKVTGIYKPRIFPVSFLLKRMHSGGINKAVLHAMDYTTKHGDTVVSNEEVARLVSEFPDDFYGFGSVDPYRDDALDVVEKAFTEQGLHGLVLDPGQQMFYPNAPELYPIYGKCVQHNKPVFLHMGISLEPGSRNKFTQLIYLDDVLTDFPQLRVGITGFGWPYVKEAATLMLKHVNLYTDTALLYFDSAATFYNRVMKEELGPLWIDSALFQQVMFGTCSGHFNQLRQADAIKKVPFHKRSIESIYEINARVFMGLEERRPVE